MSRQARFAAALVAIGVLVILWALPTRAPTPAAASKPAQQSKATIPGSRAAPVTRRSLPDPDPNVPIVDAVTLEKEEVCEGEENLVTVEAHMQNRQDDGLVRAVLDGNGGMRLPFRSYPIEPGIGAPPRQLLVQGKNGATAVLALPPFRIKPCREQQALFLRSRHRANTVSEYELSARLKSTDARDTVRPVRYEWTFGESTIETTTVPSVIHRFEEQGDRLYAHYLVGCTAVLSDGRRVMGRLSLEVRGTEYERKRFKGFISLSTEGNPRFPTSDAAGTVEQKVRIWHHQPSSVELDKVIRTLVHKDGSPGASETLDPSAVLGTREVPPDGVYASVRFDMRAEPGVSMVNYRFEGKTADGTPALGQFSLMRPAEQPRPDGPRVTDPVLVARILRARERLAKEFVTTEDLLELERQGAFDDIKPDQGAAKAKQTGDVPSFVAERAAERKRLAQRAEP